MTEEKKDKDLEEKGCCCCEHGDCSEEESEDVYIFADEDGNEKEFVLADILEVDKHEYALFMPLEEEDEEEGKGEGEGETEGEEDDEDEKAFFLRVEEDADGNRALVDLDSEEELNKVIAAWEASMQEEEEEEKK